jgi:hypothetical protein
MHGGVIYLRGTIDDYQLGKEVVLLNSMIRTARFKQPGRGILPIFQL